MRTEGRHARRGCLRLTLFHNCSCWATAPVGPLHLLHQLLLLGRHHLCFACICQHADLYAEHWPLAACHAHALHWLAIVAQSLMATTIIIQILSYNTLATGNTMIVAQNRTYSNESAVFSCHSWIKSNSKFCTHAHTRTHVRKHLLTLTHADTMRT